MQVSEIVSKYIHGTEGWAVAEQFDQTFDDRSTFDQQNSNALDIILSIVKKMIENGPFNDSATFELENYRDDLINYMDGSGPADWSELPDYEEK